MARKPTRRDFLAAAGAAAWMFMPRLGRGATTTTANDKLNFACIGVGGKGAGETGWCGGHGNLVALCDIDDRILGDQAKRYPNARTFSDFRRMFEQVKEIDAVTVVTPDHAHYPAAMMAVQLGKHILVQKPLTHTVTEARRLRDAAKARGVATQMGNQGHSGEGNRRLCEYIWDGAIGDVTEVFASTDRPIWPQGLSRPGSKPAPDYVHWDDWIGSAPVRDYHDHLHPFAWRGWLDFGCGALGDMGCHILDGPVWALKLDQAETVKVSAEIPDPEKSKGWDPTQTWPKWSIITFRFPARGTMPAVTMKWYDGGKAPPRPADLEPDRKFGIGGSYFLGSKGAIMSVGDYGGCRLVPEEKQKAYTQPPKTLPRSGGVMEDWARAARGEAPPASSNFDVSARLTEIVLLGNVAIRAGREVEYDFRTGRVVGDDAANAFLDAPRRKGWDV